MKIEIPDALVDELIRLSKKADKTPERVVHEALAEHLEDLDDYFCALEAIEENKKAGGKTYTLEEVKKELGLEDEDIS